MWRLGIPSRRPDAPTEPQRRASLSPGDATQHPLKGDWQLTTTQQAGSFRAALGVTGPLRGAVGPLPARRPACPEPAAVTDQHNALMFDVQWRSMQMFLTKQLFSAPLVLWK